MPILMITKLGVLLLNRSGVTIDLWYILSYILQPRQSGVCCCLDSLDSDGPHFPSCHAKTHVAPPLHYCIICVLLLLLSSLHCRSCSYQAKLSFCFLNENLSLSKFCMLFTVALCTILRRQSENWNNTEYNQHQKKKKKKSIQRYALKATHCLPRLCEVSTRLTYELSGFLNISQQLKVRTSEAGLRKVFECP